MLAAIEQAMCAYNAFHNRADELDGEARSKVTDYICALIEAGETGVERLAERGLIDLLGLDEAA